MEKLSTNSTSIKYVPHFGKNLLYLLISMPLGILYFTIAVCGISLGIGTSIIYIGVPITAATLILTRKLVVIDKLMAAKILNINITNVSMDSFETKGVVNKLLTIIKNPQNWYSVLYCIFKLPIGIIYFTLGITLTLLSFGFLISPFYYIAIKLLGLDFLLSNFNIGIFDFLGISLPYMTQVWLIFIIGIGLGYITLKIVNTLAQKSAEATLSMFENF